MFFMVAKGRLLEKELLIWDPKWETGEDLYENLMYDIPYDLHSMIDIVGIDDSLEI